MQNRKGEAKHGGKKGMVVGDPAYFLPYPMRHITK
jgi:hypothetical protein